MLFKYTRRYINSKHDDKCSTNVRPYYHKKNLDFGFILDHDAGK